MPNRLSNCNANDGRFGREIAAKTSIAKVGHSGPGFMLRINEKGLVMLAIQSRCLNSRWITKILVFLIGGVLFVNAPVFVTAPVFANAPVNAEEIPTYYSPNKKFAVPFSVDANGRDLIEVQLYSSEDLGRNWKLLKRKNPQDKQFEYQANGDGQIWFGLKTVDRDQRIYPPGPVKPSTRIVVDSKKPEIQIGVQPDAAGRIVVAMTALDKNLNTGSIRIQYRSEDQPNSPWQEVSYRSTKPNRSSTFVEQIAWWPKDSAQLLSVKVSIADLAGNKNEMTRQVAVPQVARINQQRISQNRPPQTLPQSAVANPFQNVSAQRPVEGGLVPPIKLQNNSNGVVWESEPVGSSQRVATGSTTRPRNPMSKISAPQVLPPSGDQFASPPNDQFKNQYGSSIPASEPANTPGDPNLVVSVGSTQPTKNAANPSSVGQPTNALPLAQMNSNDDFNRRNTPASFASSRGYPTNQPISTKPISASTLATLMEIARPTNTKKFLLTYDVSAVDPRNIDEVSLWMTADGGQSWRKWAVDADSQSPFPVEVPQEGIFGFRISIGTKDGLNSKIPRGGEAADMWVRVDQSKPTLQITSAPYGRGREAGRLVINWQANDEQLTLRPITLSYSNRPEGPWTTIETGLRNTGRYVWKVGQNVPRHVFLQIEAKDTAGNTTRFQTRQSINVANLVPRGRIKGLQPISPPPKR
jgi:hypothetical protein